MQRNYHLSDGAARSSDPAPSPPGESMPTSMRRTLPNTSGYMSRRLVRMMRWLIGAPSPIAPRMSLFSIIETNSASPSPYFIPFRLQNAIASFVWKYAFAAVANNLNLSRAM
ncbi:hypothetical protein C8R44DRAFT_894648 [Mycena epipterygia]|nr:hypothetical protein C8R44DRAFT_894648 [Mycena epipterygia]